MKMPNKFKDSAPGAEPYPRGGKKRKFGSPKRPAVARRKNHKSVPLKGERHHG